MNKNAFAAFVLALGLVLAALILGVHLQDLRQPGVITVKGVAEETHDADTAEWRLSTELTAPTYAMALTDSEAAMTRLPEFLHKMGFGDSEIAFDGVEINPNTETECNEHRCRSIQRGFVAVRSVTVRTDDLAKLNRAVAAAPALRAEFDFVRFDEPRFLLSDLENIKRSMIARAGEDAKMRAAEFAASGGVRAGAMRSASQGSFNIYADSRGDGDDEYGGVYDTSTVTKRVRLVVTVQYNIE